MNKQLEAIWEVIESWDALHKNMSLGSHLKDPASPNEVENLNQQLGGMLPVDLLDSLKRHNGSALWTTKFYKGGLFGVSEIAETLDEVRGAVQDLLNSNQNDGINAEMKLKSFGPVKNVFWSEHWIPFHMTDWSKTCLDFDPAKGGDVGQVISVNWEGDSVSVVAKNYLEFLRLCADQLPNE